jgi:hypothetical protein
MPRYARLTFLIAFLVSYLPGYGQTTSVAQDANSAAPAGSFAPVSDGWPKVILNVLVDSKSTGAVPNPASSFQILEDRTPQRVEDISGPGSPVSLCLQIDISGSMLSRRNEVRDAAISLVKNLPPGSEVMVSVFAEKSYLAAPFTPAATIDLSFLNRLKFGHRTALDDSITISEPYFVHFARYPRRAYVLISDGYDNASAHGFGDVMRSVLTPGGPFMYVLGMFDPYAAIPQPDRPRIGLLLSSARARIFMASEPSGSLKGAAAISNCIATQYALTYTSTLNTRANRLHKIEVKVPSADGHLKVESLPGYYIPAS